MKKKKVVFREFLFTIYTDGSIDMEGLEEFFNKKERLMVLRTLRLLGIKIISRYLKNRRCDNEQEKNIKGISKGR